MKSKTLLKKKKKKVWKKYNNERKLDSLRYLEVVSFVIYCSFLCSISLVYCHYYKFSRWMKHSYETVFWYSYNTIWIANISRAEDDAYVYVRNKWTMKWWFVQTLIFFRWKDRLKSVEDPFDSMKKIKIIKIINIRSHTENLSFRKVFSTSWEKKK